MKVRRHFMIKWTSLDARRSRAWVMEVADYRYDKRGSRLDTMVRRVMEMHKEDPALSSRGYWMQDFAGQMEAEKRQKPKCCKMRPPRP